MGRKRKDLPELTGVTVDGIAAEGKAIAKIKLKETDENPIVVFVPYAAPGDIINLKIDKKKSNYAEAHITQIQVPSPIRIAPKCEYFGICGGCKWQHIPYEEQLKFKRQQVVDALTRIAKVDFPEIPMTLGSEKVWAYRNKMEYTFSNKRWKSWEEIRGEKATEEGNDALGFHIPGSFDKVLHIRNCYLQDNVGDKIRNYLYKKGLELENSLSEKSIQENYPIFYDIKGNRGFLRNVMIRPTTLGELMVCLVFGNSGEEYIEITNNENPISDLLEDLKNSFPEITTLAWVVNEKVNDSISDQKVNIFYGPGYVEEKMGDLKFRISPKSFYQTNSLQAENLYKVALEFAGLNKGFEKESDSKPLIYDLYTGAGTIANFVAGKASKVVGIEYVEDAIEDAKINSSINNIDNTAFFAGDMKDVLTEEFIEKHGKPDIMIVDPPRAGMHEDVVNVILNAEPDVIVYVSCNPATQARDVALLDKKYKVTKVQPVDMFPHTHHVENVIKLEKK